MTSYARYSKYLVVVGFLTMICGPLVLSILGVGIQSETNFQYYARRAPNAYPTVPQSLNELSGYPAAFESAFNDHFPLREAAIETYGKLCVEGFQTAPNSQLLVGKNGHCFLASHYPNRSNEATLKPIQINERTVAQELEHVELYAKFLKRLHIPSVMVSIPTSHLLNFEHLPNFIQQQAHPDALQTPQNLLVMQRTKPSIRERFMLLPFQRILQANRQYPLYAAKHFHWHTGRYTRLMASSIAEHFGVAEYELPQPDEFEIASLPSDLNQFASHEMVSQNVEVYRPQTWEKLGIANRSASQIHPELPALTESFYTINPHKDGCILVVGESFTPMLNPDLARYFGTVVGINYNVSRSDPNVKKWLDIVLNEVRPEYVVFLHHQKFWMYEEFITHYNELQAAQLRRLASQPKTIQRR